MRARPARAALLAVAAVAAVLGVACGAVEPPPTAPVASARAGAPAEAVAPAQVRIPRLGVTSPLMELGVDPAGVLVPPDTADVAGWFAAGPAPGEIGPAVVAGHVDSRSGPGVFVDVATLVPGDTVEIERVDGEVVTFTVTRVQTVDKQEFPTEDVYGPTPGRELRLITCGGFFDAADGHYRANVIVHAIRADPRTWTFAP